MHIHKIEHVLTNYYQLTGLRHAKLVPSSIVAVICVRYVILPVIGIGVVKAAANLGILPSDPLFQFVLMTQFTLPPAMSIGKSYWFYVRWPFNSLAGYFNYKMKFEDALFQLKPL